jgi:hypothetical protein
MVAYGVSCGKEGIRKTSGGAAKECRQSIFLSPRPGLGDFQTAFPRLTPWAIF